MSPYALISSLIAAAAGSTLLTSLSIIVATFILEDAAMVGTGVLASGGHISIANGLISLFIGIALGDFGLYGLGRLSITHPKIKSWVTHKRALPVKRWLDEQLFSVVTATRFLPGMRLPTYVACGFFSLDFKRFAIAVLSGVAIWTPLLFGASYLFGYYTLDYLGLWRWPIALVAIGVLIIIGRRHWRKVMQETGATDIEHANPEL